MEPISVIFLIVICIVGSALLYGIYTIENDRYEFRKKHGIDPKYHGWIVEEDDDTQGDGKK